MTVPQIDDKHSEKSDDGESARKLEAVAQALEYAKSIHPLSYRPRELLTGMTKYPNREHASAFYMACKKGDFNAAIELIEMKQVDPSTVLTPSMTVLLPSMDEGPGLKFAAESGNLKLVRYLCETHHVDIEAKGSMAGTQDTALSRACKMGHLEVAIYLMSQGANPNSILSFGSVLVEAIHSKKLALVQELVRHGAKIDSWAIHYALEEGVYEITQFLLNNNTEVNLSKGHIDPFVQTAAKGGCIKTLEMLLTTYHLELFETGSILYRDKLQGYGIIISAAESGNVDMVRYLVQEYHIDIRSMAGAENSDKYAYQYNAVRSILGKAIRSKSLPLIRYLFEELELAPPQTALYSLKAEEANFSGIEINAYLDSYLTESVDEKKILLQLATQGLSGLSLPQLLILHNSRLPTKGKCSNHNHDISAQINKTGPTAEEISHLLSQYPRVICIDLLCYFSNNASEQDPTQQIDAILREDASLINTANSRGDTPLHLAIAAKGYSIMVKHILQRGANPDVPNKEGRTAINMLGRMWGIDSQALVETLNAAADYTNSLKNSVKDIHDRSLTLILKHSNGAIGYATEHELLASATNTGGKLLELLRYVSAPIFNKMQLILSDVNFISSYPDAQEHISRTLDKAKKLRATNTDTFDQDREIIELTYSGLMSLFGFIGKIATSNKNPVAQTLPDQNSQEDEGTSSQGQQRNYCK